MKTLIINYLLYVYKTYIEENKNILEITKPFALKHAKIVLFMNSIYIWFFSVVLFPLFVIDMVVKNIIKQKI